MFYAALAALICGIDCLIKYVVERNLADGELKPVWNGRLMLRKFHNTGAMLNLGGSRQQVMAMLSVIFTTFVLGIFVATLGMKGRHLLKTGLSFILGGAFSNTYDRLVRKYVVDYVSFQAAYPRLRSIVFNVSDFGIMIGSCLMVISQMREKE